MDEICFVCHMRCEDGDTCGLCFASERKLAQHQRQTRGGEHGSRCYLARITQWAECPLCRTPFKTVAGARRHVRSALEKGRCLADRSWVSRAPAEIDYPACPDPECSRYGINLAHKWE